jgi:hypothetical protein
VQSNVTPTANLGFLYLSNGLATGGHLVLPHNPLGWFQTNVGEALVFNVGTNANVVAGFLTYVTL